MLWKSIIIPDSFVHFFKKMPTAMKKQFYLKKLDDYTALISVFLCLLLLVFHFFPHNNLFFFLLVFLEPAVFFLFLLTYYFYFDWDETI